MFWRRKREAKGTQECDKAFVKPCVHFISFSSRRVERAGRNNKEREVKRELPCLPPIPHGMSVSALCHRSQLQMSISMMPVMGLLMFNMKSMTPFPFHFPPIKSRRLSLARRRVSISCSVTHKALFLRGFRRPWRIPLKILASTLQESQ